MAIDPGPVVVDGVDTVNASDHNKQRTALLALETGTTAQTTLGTISTGVWNGTTIAVANGGTASTTVIAAQNTLKTTRQILSDPGTNYATTQTKVSLLGNAKPDIPANSLAVGDSFQFVFYGSMETIGGAATTMRFFLDFDTTSIADMTTGSVAITTLVNWQMKVDARVLSISGTTCTIYSTYAVLVSATSSTNVQTSPVGHLIQNLSTTCDSTQALTIDFSSTCAGMHANNTQTCAGAIGYYTPKFA